MKRNKSVKDLIFSLVLGILLISFFSVCKSEEKLEEEKEPVLISEDLLVPVLGEWEGSVSGLIDVEPTADELKISYYFFIEDMSQFDEDIERDLAPKIQKLYRTIPELDRTAFTIYVPTEDETPYKPYVSFVITRDLVEKINWSNLLELEFFDTVMDVKYYE